MSAEMLSEGTKLWGARKAVFQMLNDRGYVVPDACLREQERDFLAQWAQAQRDGGGRERFVILTSRSAQRDQQLAAFFLEEAKPIGVKIIRVLFKMMDEKGIKEAMIVVKAPLSPPAKKAISEATAGEFRIEVFKERQLIKDITDHERVPIHVGERGPRSPGRVGRPPGSTVAPFRLARRRVVQGDGKQTAGRLRREHLKRNKKGLIVSAKASQAAVKRSSAVMQNWGEAVKIARRMLNIEGWCPVGGASERGRRLHDMAKSVYSKLRAPAGAAQ